MAANYVFYTEEDKEGKEGYYVMQKKYPSIVGKICEAPTHQWHHPIPGYHLFICFRGNIAPLYNGAEMDILTTLEAMAAFVVSPSVIKKISWINKFKITGNEIQATAK